MDIVPFDWIAPNSYSLCEMRLANRVCWMRVNLNPFLGALTSGARENEWRKVSGRPFSWSQGTFNDSRAPPLMSARKTSICLNSCETPLLSSPRIYPSKLCNSIFSLPRVSSPEYFPANYPRKNDREKLEKEEPLNPTQKHNADRWILLINPVSPMIGCRWARVAELCDKSCIFDIAFKRKITSFCKSMAIIGSANWVRFLSQHEPPKRWALTQ